MKRSEFKLGDDDVNELKEMIEKLESGLADIDARQDENYAEKYGRLSSHIKLTILRYKK